MKITRVKGLVLTCMLAALATGCGNGIVDLEDEEQLVIAEYAAGVLMEYNAGSNMRILEGQELVREETIENKKKEQEARRQQLAEEYQNKKQETVSSNSTSSAGNSTGSSQENAVASVSDLGTFLGMEPFSVTYQGYYISDTYSDGSAGNMFFAMDATAGKQFLIAQFSVTNTGSEMQTFDMFSIQPKFRLNLSGDVVGSLSTLLLDDLSMYKEDIEAGATKNTVLIFEISQNQADSLGSLELIIRDGDRKGTMTLQ